MNNADIKKVQFWQTWKSIPVFLFTAAVCVGAYFGGNFKARSLRQTDFLWWFFAEILVLICRRYYKKGTQIGVICIVTVSAVVGLLLTKHFIGIKFVEWAIYAGVILAMSLLSFLPALEFFEYKPMVKLIPLYLLFSFISLCFVVIASVWVSSIIYTILYVLYH